MADPVIRLKRSAVAGKRPTLANLELGEVALNTYDGRLFARQDTGGVGIATTIRAINPWSENYGAESIYYENSVGIGTTNTKQKTLQIDGPTSSAIDIFNPTFSINSLGDLNKYFYVDGDTNYLNFFTGNYIGLAGRSGYANEVYLIVGGYRKVLPKGWTGIVECLAFASGSFYGTSVRIQTSTDGISWTSQSSTTNALVNETISYNVSTPLSDPLYLRIMLRAGSGSPTSADKCVLASLKITNLDVNLHNLQMSGMYFPEKDGVAFGSTDFEYARFDGSGRFGINQTNPGYTLDVDGTLNITGDSTFGLGVDVDGHTELDDLNVSGVSTFSSAADFNGTADFDLLVEMDDVNVSSALTTQALTINDYSFPTSDGSADQVLQTNGSGTLSFASVLTGLGIQTAGGYIGAGITTFDFQGSGISSITSPSLGISTIFLKGITVSDTPPSNAFDDDLWLDSTTMDIKIYYNDGDTRQWVDVGPSLTNFDSLWVKTDAGIHTLASVGVGTTNPTANLDVDGRTELDITNISETLNVVGITTLASSGGITTTGGDLYVGGDARVAGILTVGTSSLKLDGFINRMTGSSGLELKSNDGVFLSNSVPGFALRGSYVGIGTTNGIGARLHVVGQIPGSNPSTGSAHDIARFYASDYVNSQSGGITLGAYWNNFTVFDRHAYIQSSQGKNPGGSGRALLLNPSGGNVTVGLAARGNTLLDVNGEITARSGLQLSSILDHTHIFRDGTNNGIAFRTGGVASNKMLLTDAGRLLVGTSTTYDADAQLQTNGIISASFYRFGADDGRVYIGSARGTVGSPTTLNSSDAIGSIYFRGHDGTSFKTGASIIAGIDGITPSSDLPTSLEFSTTANGDTSPTQRMKIDSAGQVSIATNGAANLLFVHNSQNTGGQTHCTIQGGKYTTSDTTTKFIVFKRNDGTEVGSVSRNGTTAVAFNTSSDYRLKENVVKLVEASQKLAQLNPVTFNFIGDDRTVGGFIAHEVQEVIPEAITGEKDAVDDEGNPVYQGIDQSKLVPLLTAALQEALAEIESLKARVTALEP